MPSPWAMRDHRESHTQPRLDGCHATARTMGGHRCKRTATKRVKPAAQRQPGVAVCWQHAGIVARQYEQAFGPTIIEPA